MATIKMWAVKGVSTIAGTDEERERAAGNPSECWMVLEGPCTGCVTKDFDGICLTRLQGHAANYAKEVPGFTEPKLIEVEVKCLST